ncbi:YbaK/EbsC family protein [Eubacteriales bacterium OttesenSCG-928-N13]|nr:YbaK/EbsC family protein [Eubacteriales bacterium OttesenSCG-928-N13]
MPIEDVRAYLRPFGLADRIMEKDQSSATVELAAEAVGVIPARIVKTLSFRREDGGCLLVSTAGDAKIDNAKFRSAFHIKASMLKADEVQRLTGHAVGGVCPFALPEDVQVYIDESIKRFDSVFPACGSGNSMIALSPEELYHSARARSWVDVCKDWDK